MIRGDRSPEDDIALGESFAGARRPMADGWLTDRPRSAVPVRRVRPDGGGGSVRRSDPARRGRRPMSGPPLHSAARPARPSRPVRTGPAPAPGSSGGPGTETERSPARGCRSLRRPGRYSSPRPWRARDWYRFSFPPGSVSRAPARPSGDTIDPGGPDRSRADPFGPFRLSAPPDRGRRHRVHPPALDRTRAALRATAECSARADRSDHDGPRTFRVGRAGGVGADLDPPGPGRPTPAHGNVRSPDPPPASAN